MIMITMAVPALIKEQLPVPLVIFCVQLLWFLPLILVCAPIRAKSPSKLFWKALTSMFVKAPLLDLDFMVP